MRTKTLLLALSLQTACTLVCTAQTDNRAPELLDSLQSVYAPDKRTCVWELTMEQEDGQTVVCGKTDSHEAREALQNVLAENSIRHDIRLLPDTSLYPHTWALVTISVASLRSTGRHSAELVSQATLGTPLRILERCGEFYRVQTPDRYISYIPESSVQLLTEEELERWKQSRRYVVTDLQATLTCHPDDNREQAVCDVVAGCILEYREERNGYLRLALPDGREGYLHPASVIPAETWSRQPFDREKAERYARRMMGIPYLWGGMSPKAADCSGYIRTIYFLNGIVLQRDASQQVRHGLQIAPDEWNRKAQKGDLVFIGTKPGKVSHVGMYLEDGYYIHNSGKVKINSMDPESPDYLDYHFIALTRIQGQTDPAGIWPVRSHPWYFVQP